MEHSDLLKNEELRLLMQYSTLNTVLLQRILEQRKKVQSTDNDKYIKALNALTEIIRENTMIFSSPFGYGKEFKDVELIVQTYYKMTRNKELDVNELSPEQLDSVKDDALMVNWVARISESVNIVEGRENAELLELVLSSVAYILEKIEKILFKELEMSTLKIKTAKELVLAANPLNEDFEVWVSAEEWNKHLKEGSDKKVLMNILDFVLS